MPDIFISGLASGIDTDGIIEKMMMLERRPQDLLYLKCDLYTGKKGIYSALSSRISALQDVVAQFKDIAAPFFSQKIAESSQMDVITAAIYGTNPAEGSYQIVVSQLATAAIASGQEALYTGSDAIIQPARMQSAAGINAPAQSVDPTQSLVSQQLNFTVHPQTSGTIEINGTNIDWDNNMSLNEIAGRINNSGAGVTAGFDVGTQIFTLESYETGSSAEMTISQSGGNLWDALQISVGTANGTDAVIPDFSEPAGAVAANLDISVSSGTFTINGVAFYVDAAVDSLQTIMGRINSSNAGVNANYDEAMGKISLSQKSTGSSEQIVLGTAGDSSNLLYALKLSPNNPPIGGPADTYTGTDAQVSINGGPAESYANNAVQGLIPGVTLNLKSTGSSTINIGADVDGMMDTIKSFVDEYNAVMNYINTKTREERIEDPQTAAERLKGSFVSDRLFMETRRELDKIISNVVSGLPGDMNQLAQLGITTSSANFGKDAVLELDEDKLRAVLSADPEGVEAIFNNADDGIITNLEEKIDAMTDIIYGGFTLEEKALTGEISDINKQIQVMEERLVMREETIRRQFVAMETAIMQMNAMGSQLNLMMGQFSTDSGSE